MRDQVAIEGRPQAGLFVQFLGPEAPAIDIQIPENAVAQHKHEQREKPRDQMEPPGSIQDQRKAGDRLDQRQTDGQERQQRLRRQIIGRDGRGKCLGIEELGYAAVNEEGRQGNTDNPVGPGVDHSLMENIPDLFEIS